MMEWVLKRDALSLSLWGPLAAAVILVGTGAVYTGFTQGLASAQKERRLADERETRILAFVVERNPGATIRDFQDFPRTLLRESEHAGLDYRLILAIADKESQFQPQKVGAAGEIGLLQLLPTTAALVAKSLELTDYEPPRGGRMRDGRWMYESLGSLGDPKVNVRLGIEYFRIQVTRFGMNATAVRAYNRHPDRAREDRPWDRYAEDVAIRYLALSHQFPITESIAMAWRGVPEGSAARLR